MQRRSWVAAGVLALANVAAGQTQSAPPRPESLLPDQTMLYFGTVVTAFGVAVMQRGVKSKGDAERVAERLLRAISEPHYVAGNVLQIDASIGIACSLLQGSR